VRRSLEKVGASDVTNEQEITRERANGLVSGGRIRQQEEEMLGAVAGHVPHVDANLANGEGISISEEFGALRWAKPVLPVAPAFGGEEESRTCQSGKLTSAGEEIGVNVRLGDVRYAETLCFGGGDIRLDVAQRIDYQCFAGLLGSDEIARLSEAFIV
jgi:hypothetical protein